jgi:Cu/Ag efflux protein CusF
LIKERRIIVEKMTPKLISLSLASIVIAGLFAATGIAQTDARGKSYTLHGTVEGINDFAQSIRVKQERIEGYSNSRIATYKVADAAMLKKLEIGDRIVATIYEKDDTLYDIRVVQINDAKPIPGNLPPPRSPR